MPQTQTLNQPARLFICASVIKRKARKRRKLGAKRLLGADLLIGRFIEEIWSKSEQARRKNWKVCKIRSGSYKERLWQTQQCNTSFFFNSTRKLLELKEDERITFELWRWKKCFYSTSKMRGLRLCSSYFSESVTIIQKHIVHSIFPNALTIASTVFIRV